MRFGKTALITGITGQDGALLARFLLARNYRVIGLQQWSATENTQNLTSLLDNENFLARYGDMGDSASLLRLLQEYRPDEVYNLAALSHVAASFEMPELTADINGTGTLRLLEAVRLAGLAESCRFYQASSSELFGNSPPPQNEKTPFKPCSPYGTAKLYGYWITVNYREAYGLHASNGILFNHESTIRGEHFVTRKITKAVAAIKYGYQDKLRLGNMEARRDWGHASDYVKGMWLMLQQDQPDDYILATGKAHSVREFVETAFACAGIRLGWQGTGANEQGIDRKTGKVFVEVDPELYRPNEVNFLLGDATRAKNKLGWQPECSFAQLVEEMVTSDLQDISERKPVREDISCRMAS